MLSYETGMVRAGEQRIADRAAPIVAVEGPLSQTMFAMNALARHALLGEEADAIADLERIERLWDEIANPDMRVTSCEGLGENMRLLGRFEDAERYFRRGVEALDRLGETGFNSTMTALLAHALGDLGRWDEAEEMVERSCELAAPDDFASQVEWRAVLGRILVVRGRPDEALALLDEAVAIGEPTDYLDIRGRAHEVRGEVLAVLELIEEARAELDVATDIFERMGSLPAIARCRRTLAELGE